jgi:hypothetical protein
VNGVLAGVTGVASFRPSLVYDTDPLAGGADPKWEAVMAAPNLLNSTDTGRTADGTLSLEERKQRLSASLDKKVEQGYRIESQTDTTATVVTKGHRRWFGMVSGGADTRQTISMDELGRTTTRPA